MVVDACPVRRSINKFRNARDGQWQQRNLEALAPCDSFVASFALLSERDPRGARWLLARYSIVVN